MLGDEPGAQAEHDDVAGGGLVDGESRRDGAPAAASSVSSPLASAQSRE